jgi:hypothetical protein
MLRFTLIVALAILAGRLQAQPAANPPPVLNGRVENRVYISPTGLFRITIPVLPELGGSITDTPNVVTFQDNFNVHVSIGVFPQDATQRWELSTRGMQDYLIFFFSSYVMADFAQMFPGARVESAQYAPSFFDRALITYTLLPGGSMFADKRTLLTADKNPPVAKRGNMIFVHDGSIFIISTELAERVTERSTYTKTPEQENEILRQRLSDILRRIEYTKPAAGS